MNFKSRHLSVFVAIVLALTLSCAFATITPNNYVKAPVSVCQDSENNFTNMTSLILASITPGNLFLVSQSNFTSTGNTSATNWNIWYRQLDAKTLSSGANNTASFQNTWYVSYYNNYVYSLATDNDTGIPSLRVYQASLTGGASLPRLTLSSNTNSSFQPFSVGTISISKTVYVFYLAAFNKVNTTSFVVGGSVGSLEFTFSSAYDTPNQQLSLAWGESLGNSLVFAVWIQNGCYISRVVDLSHGNTYMEGGLLSNCISGGYGAVFDQCWAYATDKKWYGALCSTLNSTTGITNYYIGTNITMLVSSLVNYSTNTSSLAGSFQYDPFLALVYLDTVTAAPSQS
jgi:hypothetical protein